MLVTILLLIFTVVILPIICFCFGTPLNNLQVEILYNTAYIVVGVIIYCFLLGEITQNNSQVDKLWSIVPVIYSWHMTYMGGMQERMVLMAILVTIWGVRLTFNFARKGAYSWRFWTGEEDYRWEILRKRPGFNNRVIWALFDLFFICGYQNILIFLFTLPILTCLADGARPLQPADYILAALFLVFVAIEFVADEQQHKFQTEKYRRINNNLPLEEYEQGFLSKGLWAYSRHPNYTSEQAIWIVFYLFSVVATGEWINWSVAGCILLLLLFKGSSDFSESISAAKYAGYKDYQSKVSRFLPFKGKYK